MNERVDVSPAAPASDYGCALDHREVRQVLEILTNQSSVLVMSHNQSSVSVMSTNQSSVSVMSTNQVFAISNLYVNQSEPRNASTNKSSVIV